MKFRVVCPDPTKFQVLHIYTKNLSNALKALTDKSNLQKWVDKNVDVFEYLKSVKESNDKYSDIDYMLDEFSFVKEEMTNEFVNIDIIYPCDRVPYATLHLDAVNDDVITKWKYYVYV